MEGRRFRRGRVFVTQNCTLKCRCRKNGVPRCAPLCKTKRKVPVCGPDERLAEILDLFAGGRCTCETKTCISTASKWASEVSRSQNPAKQTQHFKAAYCNIVAHNILHTFGHLKQYVARGWMVKQDGQACATCCVQQCCNMLR